MNSEQSHSTISRRPFRWTRLSDRDFQNELAFEDDHRLAQKALPKSHEISLLDAFLETHGKSPRLQYEGPVFRQLFGERLFERISDGDFTQPEGLVAWLNDRDEGNAPRPYNGAMPGDQILGALKLRVRKQNSRLDALMALSDTLTSSKRFGEDGMVDAHFRRIYIPNPGTFALGVVILKSPSNHTSTFRNLIFKHLTGATTMSLGRTVHSEFVLELHLSYYVWRNNSSRCDSRPSNMGSSWRWDMSSWTALCLTDSYYDDDQDGENPYMLPYYSMEDTVLCEEDAISIGTLMADKTAMKDAREYFSAVCAIHANRITEEWDNVYLQLRDKIPKYIYNEHFREPIQHKQNAHVSLGRLQEDSLVVTRTRETLRRLQTTLKRTIMAGSRFLSEDARKLEHQASPERRGRVQESLWDLSKCNKRMEKISEQLSDLENVVDNLKAQFDTLTEIESAKRAGGPSWTFPLTDLTARTKHILSYGANSIYRSRSAGAPMITDGLLSQTLRQPIVGQLHNASHNARGGIAETDAEEPNHDIEERKVSTGLYAPSIFPGDLSVTDSVNTKIRSTFSEEFVSTQPSSTWGAIQLPTHHDDINRDLGPSRNGLNGSENFGIPEDELQSVASANEEIQSVDGRQIVSPNLRWAAASGIAEVLTGEPELARMYQDSVRCLDDERFIRNHARLLKSFFLVLRSQAVTEKQKLAVGFLRMRIHRRLISSEIRSKMKGPNESKGKDFDLNLNQSVYREETLQRFLDSVVEPPEQNISPTGDFCDGTIEPTEPPLNDGESENDSLDDDEEHIDGDKSPFINLEETRNLFKSGQALEDFKLQLHNFLYPDHSMGEKSHSRTGSGSKSSLFSKFTAWGPAILTLELLSWATETTTKALRDRPWNEEDFKRISYTCGCGESVVLEVRERLPQGITRLKDRLEKDITPNQILSCLIQNSSGDSPQTPQAAHFRPERSNPTLDAKSTSISPTSLSEQRRGQNQSSASSSQNELATGESRDSPQFLLLCVNQKALPVLRNVDLSGICSDQFLFQQILLEYKEARRTSDWKPSFLIPPVLFNLMSHVSRVLKLPKWQLPDRLRPAKQILKEAINLSLYRIDKGDFVRFQLVPVRETEVPSRFKYGEFPPSGEVDVGNYLYAPVPMDEVEIRIPLWHLTQPGPHSDKFWIKTFPKKLKLRLQRHPGEERPIIGWGIRVSESLNWSHVLFLILVVILLIGGCVCLYSVLKSDDSSAFGLGAFLAAVFAVYIPFKYHSWKEKID